MNNLDGYEQFIQNETPENKLRFLEKTIYNTKMLRKTIDLRKIRKK